MRRGRAGDFQHWRFDGGWLCRVAATLLLAALACDAKSGLAKHDEQQRIARGQPPAPEPALLPDSTSALIDRLAGDLRIEVREIDDTTPYPPYGVPYLIALERQKRFAHEPGISTLEIPSSVAARGLELPATLIVVAAARETLEHFFTGASAELPLASTHALRYGLTPWRLSLEGAPELWWRAYLVRVDSGFVADGAVRVSAEEGRGELGGRAVVIDLDRDAAVRYGAFTREHIGKRVALMVGGLVFGDPIVLEPIENGRIYLNVEQHTDVHDVAARLATRLGL